MRLTMLQTKHYSILLEQVTSFVFFCGRQMFFMATPVVSLTFTEGFHSIFSHFLLSTNAFAITF